MTDEKLVSKARLAELLGVSQRTIEVWRRAKVIRAIKIKNIVRFDPDDVVKQLKEASQEYPN